MKIYFFLLVWFSFFHISCRQEHSAIEKSSPVGTSTPDTNQVRATDVEIKADTSATNLTIPSPCELISSAELKSIFKVSSDITYNAGSQGATSDKSCFFRIEDKKSNGAIMVQISTNPLPAEIDDYPIRIIEGKMTQGEQNPVDGKAAKYTSLSALGDMGCYNYAMGKYTWHYNKDYLYLIAFNTSHNEKDQKAMAIEVAKIINKNFQSSINSK